MLIGDEEDAENFYLTNIKTPINAVKLEELLIKTEYDPKEMRFLVNGFRHGFDLYYQGSWNRKNRSRNIPFTVGD